MKKNHRLRKKIAKRVLLGFVLLSTFCILPGIETIRAADVPYPSATDLERINPDTVAPDFNLVSVEGTHVKLSRYQDRKNVILIFYRGYW